MLFTCNFVKLIAGSFLDNFFNVFSYKSSPIIDPRHKYRSVLSAEEMSYRWSHYATTTLVFGVDIAFPVNCFLKK